MEKGLQVAIREHRRGNVREAERLYREALKDETVRDDASKLLAAMLLQQQRFVEAAELLHELAERNPGSAEVHNNLGVALKAAGRRREAAEAFERALASDPRYSQAWYNLGLLVFESGHPAEAEPCFRNCIALCPSDTDAYWQLAAVLSAQGRRDEAEAVYRQLLEVQPSHVAAMVNLAGILVQRQRWDEAETLFRDVLRYKPEFAEIHSNLSYVAEQQGRFEEAIEHARRALRLKPSLADAHNNWGVALRSLHQLQEACQHFEQALRLRPDFALAEFNLATTRLLSGDFTEGWPGYERRFEAAGQTPRRFTQPRWDGRSCPGQCVLVYSDQGFGDAIQFVRFLRLLKERTQATVLLESPAELALLLANVDGVDEVVRAGEPLPAFDFHLPLASVPVVLDADEAMIRTDVPYLHAADTPRAELQQLLHQAGSGRSKVGLVWQGNPAQQRDALRSCPLDRWLELADVSDICFFSLQTEPSGREQLIALADRWPIVDLGAHLRDFADTAAVLEQLDLLISVDTAAAHLAGALGRPVWTLLCHTPDWRWLLDRPDTPWYPTMRLFRQPQWGDWPAVIRQVRAELIRWVERRGHSEPTT
ncbi:MAG: tetratricopeptide repeat protein [Planctomycetes bacterium]|nr:tetratricopeptide repeat protein [Planctomycetota bacterium]